MSYTVQGRGDSTGAALRSVLGWTALGLLCTVALAMAFLVAWQHVRYSPGLVDDWPGGAPGFGLSCAAAVLAGRGGAAWCLRRGTARARIRTPGAVLCAVPCMVLGLLGVLYGLAVVPPRWCYQSTSPHCGSLPGAAEAGLAFLGALIAAFFAKGALSTVTGLLRQLGQLRRRDRASGTRRDPARWSGRTGPSSRSS